MKLIALRDLSYDGQRILAGRVFEAANRYGKVLKAVGRAADHIEPTAELPVTAPSFDPEPSLSQTEPEANPTEEALVPDVSLTPVEPMTTKDNGALVPTRRGVYRRRDIEPGQAAVMAAEPAAAPGDDTSA